MSASVSLPSSRRLIASFCWWGVSFSGRPTLTPRVLTAAPAAQAGLLLHAIEDAGKVAAEDAAKKAAEAAATGVKIENKVLSPEAKAASLEATGVK
jgi:hypothetical protein